MDKATEEAAQLQLEAEVAKAEAEAAEEAAENADPLEVDFDDENANYQEDLFMKHSVRPMSNKDIIESVGLEYKHVSYEVKPKKKKKAWEAKSPIKAKAAQAGDGDDDFAAEEIEDGDQALPDEEGSEDESARSSAKASSAKAVSVDNPTKDYVAATLNAWNSCPTIVKK